MQKLHLLVSATDSCKIQGKFDLVHLGITYKSQKCDAQICGNIICKKLWYHVEAVHEGKKPF